MGSSVFGIGLSGLKAANLGLSTAGHNISNVNTAGYSRQTILQSAPYPSLTGSGFVGLGVQVDNITRSYDQFLTKQVQSAQAQSSYYETYNSHMSQIDNLVADSTTGVTPAIQDYFSAVQNVATNPSNLPARETLLSSAQTMVNRFQMVNQQLADQRTALNGEITNAVSSINSYAKQIADLNQQIVLTSGTGLSPNDLLDQRDQMVKELNSLVKASTVTQSDGSINVFVGTGQNLVVGGNAFELAAVQSLADPLTTTVAYKQNSSTIYLPENSLGGGQLGALLDFRTSSLNEAQNSLGMVAVGMAQMLNAQQQAGVDLNGVLGQDLFDFNRESVSGVSVSPPKIGSIPKNSSNTGSAEISGYISDVSQLQPSDYELRFESGVFTLTRLSDGESVASSVSLPISVDGLTLTVDDSTLLASGDKFTIKPYQGFIDSLSVAITDARDLAAALPVRAETKSFDPSGSASALSSKLLTSQNTGTAKIVSLGVASPSTTTTDEATDPLLQTPIGVEFTDSTHYSLYDLSTTPPTQTASNQVLTDGKIELNGWTLTLSGTPAADDQFVVIPNTSGTEDGGNMLKMAALQTTKLLSEKTATFEQSYSQMVANVGAQTNEVSIMAESQASMLTQAEAARDSVSGVNLDEEAASLLRYQQAYIAASKLIQIAQQAFDEIANIV